LNELPKGWIKCRLDEISNIYTGKTPSKNNPEYFGGSIPFIKPGDVNNQGFIETTEETLSEIGAQTVPIIPENAIAVTCIGNLGRVGITTKKSVTNQQINTVVPNSLLIVKYLYFYLRTIRPWMETEASATTVTIINKSRFSAAPVLLAPLNEQKRIADKLDSILAKVDRAQARLDKVPGILKRFRQSVLAAATSGELTKEWREQNGVSLTSWDDTIFSELSREITVGFVGKMSDKYQDAGVKFLRSQNVRAFKFDPKNLLYISPEFHQEIYKSRLEAGDLAVVRSGAPGTTCVIPSDLGETNCSDLVIVRPNDKLVSEFGCIFMNSSVAQQNVKENQVGVAQQHFNVGSMKVMPISLPPINEQLEIVRRVHDLFALAEVVEKNYNDAIKKIRLLSQSVLAKAFRGELVEQRDDETAEALLDRIKSLQRNPTQTVKRTRKAAARITVKAESIATGTVLNQFQTSVWTVLEETANELTPQQILNTFSEKTFEQVDALFAALKHLVDSGMVVKIGAGENCSFRANSK
jgi:type I restriction enzyme S subunit